MIMRMVMMMIMYIIAITLLSYRTVINKESAENDNKGLCIVNCGAIKKIQHSLKNIQQSCTHSNDQVLIRETKRPYS